MHSIGRVDQPADVLAHHASQTCVFLLFLTFIFPSVAGRPAAIFKHRPSWDFVIREQKLLVSTPWP